MSIVNMEPHFILDNSNVKTDSCQKATKLNSLSVSSLFKNLLHFGNVVAVRNIILYPKN